MDKQEQVKKQPTRMKIIVIILAALLVLSAGGLAGPLYLSGLLCACTLYRNRAGQSDRRRSGLVSGWGRHRIIRPHNERRPWFGAAVR